VPEAPLQEYISLKKYVINGRETVSRTDKLTKHLLRKGQEVDMGKDIRYKVEHMGDSFAGMLTKVVSASKSSAKGVILTYDIRQLTRKKEALITEIGTHVARISKENSSLIQDENLKELLERHEETDKRLSAYVEERKNLLYPTQSFCSAEATTTDLPQSV
jgi:hypothetical protein